MITKLLPFHIAGPGYEEFVKALTEIAYTACEYGAQKLQEAGKTPDDLKTDAEAQQKFFGDCHYGFAKAQSMIGEMVIAITAQIAEATEELKEARRSRDKEKAQELSTRIAALENRQLATRRVEDYIYYMVLNRQTHAYRRFLAQRKALPVDPDVLREALKFAEFRNSETPLRFTLVADLTTAMHMADLIEIDASGPEPQLSIIEMKTGEMNRELLEMLSKKPDEETIKRLDSMGDKAWKQIERIMRQHERLKGAHTVLKTDSGTDELTKMPIRLLKEPVLVDGFLDAVMEAALEAEKEGVSGRKIDECLSLVAIRDDCGLTITDGLIAHFLYHLEPDTLECAIAKGEEAAKEEFRRVAKWRQFADIGDFLLRDLFSPGLFSMVPTPIALDVVIGRLRLYARFDVPKFFAHAETHGIKLTWGTKKESARAISKKLSAQIPGAPREIAVAHYAVGDSFKGTLFSGFFMRPFRDLLRSNDLIEFLKARAAQDSAEEEN